MWRSDRLTLSTAFTDDAAIERVGRGLLDRSLPKAEWSHAGHFAAAFWLLRERGYAATVAQMPALIRTYNETTGVANTDTSGFHATITLASLAAARSVLEIQPHNSPLHHAINLLLAGEFGRSDWLLRHWSRALLFSADARRMWVAPDLLRLPFPV